MLIAEHLEKEYGLITLLKDASFSIGRGQKVALIGNNGSGKSTLLKMLAGKESPDRGVVRFDPSAVIGYVPQDIVLPSDQSIEDFLYHGIDERDELFEQRVMVLLKGFGFEPDDLHATCSTLSGGQRRKICLVQLFLNGSNVLLLDEPTNDLDLPSIIWLESLLVDTDAAVLVASHDRRFLDRTVSRILEIDDLEHTMTMTNGRYSEYLIAVESKRRSIRLQYEHQQEEISRLESRVDDLKQRGQRGNAWKPDDRDKLLRDFKRDRSKRSGRRAKAIEKRIGQMDKIDKPFERKPLEILLPERKKQGNRDIVLEDVVAGYPEGFQLKSCSLYLSFGKRCGFIGLNGRGKTTLLQTIVGKRSPIQGMIRIGSGVRFGHLTQEHESLDRASTPLEVLQSRAGLDREKAFLLLDIFGIDPKRAHDAIRSLSPGKRVRLILAIFSALEVNVLILDEPTNHLDLEALAALEEVLDSFNGTVILVSHDREFVESAGLDMMYLLDDTGSISLIQDYTQYVIGLEREAKDLWRILKARKRQVLPFG